jgi:hypothetical protein
VASNLYLDELPPDLQVTVTKKETDSERRVRLAKDLAVFGLAIAVLILAVVWAGWTLFQSSASTDNKHDAQSILIAVVSGLLGYLVKK